MSMKKPTICLVSILFALAMLAMQIMGYKSDIRRVRMPRRTRTEYIEPINNRII